MELLSLLVLSASLVVSFIVAWGLVSPFFDVQAAAAVLRPTSEQQVAVRKELLLSELEELEQDFKDGAIDAASYAESKNLLLRELAPFFSASPDTPDSPNSPASRVA